MKIDTRRIRKIHRVIGIFFVVSLLASAGSGVLHNVMSRTQSAPPKPRPSGKINPESLKISVPQAFSALKSMSGEVNAVSVRPISGSPWYQFLIEGSEKPLYVDGVTGKVDDTADERYASQIASNYLGGAEVYKTDFLTRFNGEYISIFRILPVYRFDTDDGKGTRVYVSTMTGSVTRHTDNRKQLEANIFSYVHKFMFIRNKDLRDFILTFMTAGVFVTGIFGIVLFVVTRKKRG